MEFDYQRFAALCEKTDEHLWRSYRQSVDPANAPPEIAVLFPLSGGSVGRVSEQEARFAFAIELAKHKPPLNFVPEHPTTLRYLFDRRRTGANGKSAQTDLAIYDRNGKCNGKGSWLNIEFKSGGYSSSRKDTQDIRKDCVKLLCEPRDGAWFHVFWNVNNTTITSTLTVLEEALTYVRKDKVRQGYLGGQETLPERDKKEIAFHFVVLEKGFSFRRLLPNPWDADLREFFRPIAYEIKKSKLDFDADSGWTLHREQRTSR